MGSGSSNGRRRTGAIVTGALAGALTLTAAACGSSTPAAPSAAGASSSHPVASHSAAASAAFGSDCGMIPATGMGSLHGMSMDPVLTRFHNRVLFIKHNLNAQAIASLQTQVTGIQGDVDRLIKDMDRSIQEANAFIGQIK